MIKKIVDRTFFSERLFEEGSLCLLFFIAMNEDDFDRFISLILDHKK